MAVKQRHGLSMSIEVLVGALILAITLVLVLSPARDVLLDFLSFSLSIVTSTMDGVSELITGVGSG